jgi:hypothetical protein
MKSIAHEVQPHLWAKVVFSGDVSNGRSAQLIDASFKTFCTPLRLQYPVKIEHGTKVSQSVALQIEGASTAQVLPCKAVREQPLQFVIGDSVVRTLPPLGLGMASHNQPLTERELQRLRALHYRICVLTCRLQTPSTAHPETRVR